jgi:hypothetical protein
MCGYNPFPLVNSSNRSHANYFSPSPCPSIYASAFLPSICPVAVELRIVGSLNRLRKFSDLEIVVREEDEYSLLEFVE